MSKTVLLQAIQFIISTQFDCVWDIDRTLSGATAPSQSGPGRDENQGVLRIPGTSLSDRLVPYLEHSLGGGGLLLCRKAVGVFYSPSQMGKGTNGSN